MRTQVIILGKQDLDLGNAEVLPNNKIKIGGSTYHCVDPGLRPGLVRILRLRHEGNKTVLTVET